MYLRLLSESKFSAAFVGGDTSRTSLATLCAQRSRKIREDELSAATLSVKKKSASEGHVKVVVKKPRALGHLYFYVLPRVASRPHARMHVARTSEKKKKKNEQRDRHVHAAYSYLRASYVHTYARVYMHKYTIDRDILYRLSRDE